MATSNAGKGARGRAAQDALREAMADELPVFPFPKGLNPDFFEIWVQTVNTKTGDYWSKGDIPLLKLYCRVAHDIERLDLEILDEGEVILNTRENLVVNPKIMVRGFAEGRLLSLATKLHLQPASRMDTKNEANQGKKKGKATRAANVMAEDDDGLLGGHGMSMQ